MSPWGKWFLEFADFTGGELLWAHLYPGSPWKPVRYGANYDPFMYMVSVREMSR